MTELLRQVISEIEKLPASQQDAIVQRLPWSIAKPDFSVCVAVSVENRSTI